MARISQPRPDEPIRLVETAGGVRYRAVMDIAPKGAKRRQVTRTFGSLTEARAFVTETRDMLARGTYTAPAKVTVEGLCADWLTSRRDVRNVTLVGYRNALRIVTDHLGPRPVQSITRKDVEGLVTWAAVEGSTTGEPLAQRTLTLMLGTLRQVLAYGVISGVLHSNVAIGVKAPRRTLADHKNVTVWTVDEMVRFRAVADNDPWAVGLRLLLCGLRRSEVAAAGWSDVDLDAGTVRVAASRVVVGRGVTETDGPKSAASARTVPVERMHSGTVAMLRSLKVRQSAERLAAGSAYVDSGLVVADALGHGIHPDALTARWRKVCRLAGVPEVGTHAVRHTLATALHQAGEAPADVAALLGHTTNVHLNYYVQRTERGAARAADRLGEVLAAVR